MSRKTWEFIYSYCCPYAHPLHITYPCLVQFSCMLIVRIWCVIALHPRKIQTPKVSAQWLEPQFWHSKVWALEGERVWLSLSLECWDWALKSKIWYNKNRLNHPLVIILVYWHWFNHSVHISYIVHDLGSLGVTQKIQVMGSLLVDKLSTIGSWIWAI